MKMCEEATRRRVRAAAEMAARDATQNPDANGTIPDTADGRPDEGVRSAKRLKGASHRSYDAPHAKCQFSFRCTDV